MVGPVFNSVIAGTDGLRVIKLADTGPAAKAGVMAGDLITAIDDKSIKGLTLEAAFRRISGPVNAAIKLKIFRQNQSDPIIVTFTREAVPFAQRPSFEFVSQMASWSLKQRRVVDP